MPLTRDEFDAMLRSSLPEFIHRTFVHLNPHTPYVHNWHHDLIADRLTQVADGRIRRLIVTTPPRSLKSTCASVAFPAWLLGRGPSKRIVSVSHSQDLATRFGRDTLDVMASPWYRRAFTTRVLGQNASADDFQTTALGGRIATSIAAPSIGRGGGLVIIDGPMKPDDAMSAARRRAVNGWFDRTVYSRLDDKNTGAIIIFMHRSHLDDLVGHVIEKETWEIVNLPGIATTDERWTYHVPLRGQVVYERAPGAPLHGARESTTTLEALRGAMGETAFSAQYLQAPMPQAGVIQPHWLARYTADGRPAQFEKIVQSWTTTSQTSGLPACSVCTTWGVNGQTMHLLHVLRERIDRAEFQQRMIAHMSDLRATHVLIASSEHQLVRELKSLSSSIRGVTVPGDTETSLRMHIRNIENGRVLFPEQSPWLTDYLNELIAFPMSKHDSQVASTVQALHWVSALRRVVTGEEINTGEMWIRDKGKANTTRRRILMP